MSRSIICIYHAPCNDGAASAAALEYRLRNSNYLNGDFRFDVVRLAHSTEWNEEFPQDYIDAMHPNYPVEEIFIVDAVISRMKHQQLLRHLHEIRKIIPNSPVRTICIDHHATALEKDSEIRGYCDEVVIKMGQGLSGATLVWQYCNERFEEHLPTPQLLRYVADQDIWEWKLPDSREINAALNTLEGDAHEMREELDESLRDESAWYQRRKTQGTAVLAMVNSQIRKSMAHVLDVPKDGYTLRVVNASAFSSELGNFLCEHSDDAPNAVALIYSIQKDLTVKCSLRSISGGRMNARTIAEQYGGGGHDNAAGCRFGSFREFSESLLLQQKLHM